MELLEEAPNATAFIPLVEHQSTTPSSFYSGPPVLHYYSDRCKVLVLESDLSSHPNLSTFLRRTHPKDESSGDAINGHHTDQETDSANSQRMVVEEVDVWVTSE